MQIKFEYMLFLIHCYIDTEVEMKEIFSREYIWTVFTIFINDVEKVPVSKSNFFLSAPTAGLRVN